MSRDSRPYNGTSLSIWSRSLRLAAEQLETTHIFDESDWEQEEKRLRVGTSKNVTVYIFFKKEIGCTLQIKSRDQFQFQAYI